MVDKGYKILKVIYHALVGVNMGFVLDLLLAQWTWLELRVNTGALILLGCLIGAIYGLIREVKRPILIGNFSVLAVVATSLIITQGDFESTRILMGVMFREGTLMCDLSLRVANLIILALGLLTIIISWVHYRAYYSNSQMYRSKKA